MAIGAGDRQTSQVAPDSGGWGSAGMSAEETTRHAEMQPHARRQPPWRRSLGCSGPWARVLVVLVVCSTPHREFTTRFNPEQSGPQMAGRQSVTQPNESRQTTSSNVSNELGDNSMTAGGAGRQLLGLRVSGSRCDAAMVKV